jgi:hypothetical protein
MQVVFDTNVLISQNPDTKDFVGQLMHEFSRSDSPLFKVVLDSERAIQDEYKAKLDQLMKTGEITRQSPLHRLYSQIRRMASLSSNKHFIKVSGTLTDQTDIDFLRQCNAVQPIEPSLFGVLRNSPQPKLTYVYLMGDSQGRFNRGYPCCYADIRSRFLTYNDYARELLKALLFNGRCPDTWAHMNSVLEAIRVCGKPLEGERHEFKSTLDDAVYDDLPKTVCSLLNKDGGVIFLGVDETSNYQITGIPWQSCQLDGRSSQSAQELYDRVENKVRTVDPYPAEKIRIEVVKGIPANVMSTQNIVIVIHVLGRERSERWYYADGSTGGRNRRFGIWIRSGSKVIYRDDY